MERGLRTAVWSVTEEDPLEATISPDGARLVLGHTDGRIELVDLRSGASTLVTSSLSEGLTDLTWGPDGATFAGATPDPDRARMGCRHPRRDRRPPRSLGKLSQLAYSPDGSTLYAAAYDQAVLAWDLIGNTGAVREVDDKTYGRCVHSGVVSRRICCGHWLPDDDAPGSR